MSFLKELFSTKINIAGIDIGTSLIKIIQLNKTAPDKYQLVKVVLNSTPAALIKDGIIIDTKALGENIKQLISTNRFNINKVVASVSGQSVVMRPINMPQMSDKELQNAIRFEAERYLPYSVADAQIKGIILRKSIEGDEKNMEVLLVAAPNEMVKKAEETMKLAGLSVQAIDLEPFALLRTLRLSVDAETFSRTIALIDLGANTSSINIYKAGVLRHNRTIGLAGNNFTKVIGQSLNLSFGEAEKIKKDKGIIRLEGDATPLNPTAMRIFNVITPIISELVTEIQRSFDYYRSRYRGESVDLVVLSGGTSSFKNIDAYLKNELGISCQIAKPFKNVNTVNCGFPAEEIEDLSPALVVAAGLAIREFV
ncbi:MAG: type IV pilus assembly protein PilM [Armatimonadetes bacterium]|nr:type IV pilus assembly protein PilM [Armatimonadota bacterium]